MGNKKKFNYDAEEFYNQIYALASSGATDDQIASQLIPSLRGSTFKAMKNGTYNRWTILQNRRRSERIQETLNLAHSKVGQAITNVVLRSMLGKNKSVVTVEKIFVQRDASGAITSSTEVKTVTTTELAPNTKLIEKWLNHQDKDWRKIEQEMKGISLKEIEEEQDDTFNINILYRNIKDLGLQEKS